MKKLHGKTSENSNSVWFLLFTPLLTRIKVGYPAVVVIITPRTEKVILKVVVSQLVIALFAIIWTYPLADSPYRDHDQNLRFVHMITAYTFLTVWFAPLAANKRSNLKLIVLELIWLASLPIVVHFVGTYVMNNVGGLSAPD